MAARRREERVEPPTPNGIERVLGAAEPMFERHFTEATVRRLTALSTEATARHLTALSVAEVEESIVGERPGR